MSGKGDTPRPFAVKAEVYANNYCLTFGHKLRDGRCRNCGEMEAVPGKDAQPIEGQA